jgi:tetratricopeptide (TPR) repeat protein
MSCKKVGVLSLLVFVMWSAVTAAQEQKQQEFSLGMFVSPEIAIPVGTKADYYAAGYGGKMTGIMVLPGHSLVTPRFDISYHYLPLNTTENAVLSIIRSSAGLQTNLLFGERFTLFAYGAAGGYYGSLSGPNEAMDFQISVHGGGGVSFQLFNDVSLTLGAEYCSFLGTYDGLGIFLGVTTRLTGSGGGGVPMKELTSYHPEALPAGGRIRIKDVRLDTVFPVLRKYYDNQPIGTAVVSNIGNEILKDVEIRVQPSAYIDSPKLSARIPSLEPDDEREVDLYVLFNEEILAVSEGAKVVTDIRVNYRVNEREGSDTETVTLETYDRNALQWDDDRKIAAFVTAKDDEIQRFAKNMASLAKDNRVEAVSEQMQMAMLQYCALVEQGLTYVIDPSSSYEKLSDNPLAVDFVQFPRQTLYVKAGDCDDLSAAYCTLLESVGVETAFITVPGHIFMAFRLDMEAAEARRAFSAPQELIVRDDGSVWVPVETTMLREGFLEAWAEGARKWRMHMVEGQVGFFTTKRAWNTFQPVAFSVSRIELGMPQRDGVLSRFVEELNAYVSHEIYPRAQALEERLKANPGNPGILNRLGVLYARYGRYEEAREQFEKIIDQEAYIPAIINLANLDFIAGDLRRARRGYKDALLISPDNPSALLGLSKTERELENFGSSRSAYGRLLKIAPQLARKYAYLGADSHEEGVGRASDTARLRLSVAWEEER